MIFHEKNRSNLVGFVAAGYTSLAMPTKTLGTQSNWWMTYHAYLLMSVPVCLHSNVKNAKNLQQDKSKNK